MGSIYIVGICAGTIMFIAKWCGMILLTGGKKGVNLPLFGKIYPYLWIMKSHVRRGLLDLGLSTMVAHIFMGSIVGMIGAITFAALSIGTLMFDIIIAWFINKFKELNPLKRETIHVGY